MHAYRCIFLASNCGCIISLCKVTALWFQIFETGLYCDKRKRKISHKRPLKTGLSVWLDILAGFNQFFFWKFFFFSSRESRAIWESFSFLATSKLYIMAGITVKDVNAHGMIFGLLFTVGIQWGKVKSQSVVHTFLFLLSLHDIMIKGGRCTTRVQNEKETDGSSWNWRQLCGLA